jgi:hypothetical protein
MKGARNSSARASISKQKPAMAAPIRNNEDINHTNFEYDYDKMQ